MSSASPSPDVVGALDRLESLLAGGTPPAADLHTDPAVVRWLCLVPAWTPVLAARCGLPSFGEPHDAVLEAWRADGLVERMSSPLTMDATGQVLPAQELFWARRDTRSTHLARVLAEDGRWALAGLASDIARRILAQPRDAHVPSSTWRWAVLMSQAVGTALMLGAAFEHEIAAALAAQRPEDAWAWIEALQRVAEVVPGEATLLQQRAVRQLALFDRQRTDLALLRDYLPRPALFEAYRALLTGPDDAWALHYLGGGGVGKTMLMRALTSGTERHRPPDVELPPSITARIDFDHINPDYPARRPGLLFAHLAEELRLKDESLRASEGFSLLFRKIGLLHERAGHEGTTEAEIDDMLDMFAWACTELARSRDARVVLLLDTCEELARLGVDGRLPDSVERTFDLLTRLHARLPALRVVFCGRRPLAGTYAGGEPVALGLPARPWLALERVHAFSEEEAKAYLSRVHVPAALVDPILMRSGAAASSSALGLRPEAVIPRFSPFSLSVYAAWVARQRDLTPATILDDRIDHFVKIRILERIHNADVQRLLPHIALLGRFDEATLRACADLRADVADAVLRELGSQEWIDRQAGGYYAVEEELRVRLLRYFTTQTPADLGRARARILPVLRGLLEAGSATDVPDEAVVQAITELQPGDREAMLATWRVLDARIVAGAHATWGARVLGRLLADEHGLASPALDPGVWAAAVTTYAECLLRTQGVAAPADLWPRAWERAPRLADPHLRASVQARIAAGGLAACGAGGAAVAGEVDRWAMRLFDLVTVSPQALSDPPQVAPVVAAVMACADALDRRGDPLAPAEPMLERLAVALTDVESAPLRALALTCVGRLAARRQDADAAHTRLVEALAIIGTSTDRDLPPSLHWPPALDAPSWVTLEALRRLEGLEPVDDTLARFTALAPVRSVTALNRIEALHLRMAAAVRDQSRVAGASAPAAPARVVREQIGKDDVAPVESIGQALVPPRAVAIAIDLVEHGRPAEGLRMLGELTSLATSARNTVVAAAAEAARVEAVTRLRLGEHGRLSRLLSDGLRSLDILGRERARAFIDTDGGFLPESTAQIPDDTEVATTRLDAHAVWRARRAFTAVERRQLTQAGPYLLAVGSAADGAWANACVALDVVECSELGADVASLAATLPVHSPEDWWSRHPALPMHALRLWVRSAALGVSPGGPTTQLVRRVGVRRAAAIALEEGELLALRLPAAALRLLALALTWFEDAGDQVGTWQVQVLLAMTRIRAGVPREAVDLAGLRAAHQAMTGTGANRGTTGLPPWDRLVSVPSLPLPDAGTAEWTPWLHRAIAVHYWVSAGVRPEVLFARPDQVPLELRAWPVLGGSSMTTETAFEIEARRAPRAEPSTAGAPSTQVGDPFTGGVTVPGTADTGTVPGVPPMGMPLPAPGPPAARVPSRRLARVGLVVGAILLLLALAAFWAARQVGNSAPIDDVASTGEPIDGPPANGRVTGKPPTAAAEMPMSAGAESASRADAFGTTTAAPTIPGGSLAPAESSDAIVWPGLLVAGLVLAAAGSWIWIRRQRAAAPVAASVAVAPQRAWHASVVASGGEGTYGRAGALDATVTLIDDDGQVASTAPVRMRRADAYAGLDALRQPPSGTVLATALSDAGDVDRIDMHLPARAAWPCWEALLWSGTVEGSRIDPPVVRHVSAPGGARPFRPTSDRLRVALVVDSPSEARQATYAWEASVRAERVALSQASAEQVRAGQALGGVGLVHVVAATVETPQGLFVEAQGRDVLQGASLESLKEDRGTLFDASQLAHVFPEASCMLLQPPRHATLELTPAGREACATARLFGAALAEQGIPIVVVLPPLDGELGAHLVRLLGRRVPALAAGRHFDTIGLVRRARQMVFEHAQRLLPRDAAIELALQVTVYVA